MKACTGCGTVKDVCEFSADRSKQDNLCCQCKDCNSGYQKAHKAEAATQKRKYAATIVGYLHRLYRNTMHKCYDRPGSIRNKCYRDKGVECKFGSFEKFASYITEVLEIDPRGLDLHRIDNDGHYEPGNIKFIDHDEHVKLHKYLRNKV